jgi:prevent-host-death family protein
MIEVTPVASFWGKYGYNGHIEFGHIEEHAVRSTNIADLRNHLTRYLKEVRAGEEIVVRDRNLPFAKIVPLAHDDEASENPRAWCRRAGFEAAARPIALHC